jgi:gas vesicle protein
MDIETVKALWPEFKSVIESGAIVVAAVALAYAALRIPKAKRELEVAAKQISDDLSNTAKVIKTDLNDILSAMRVAADEIKTDLTDTLRQELDRQESDRADLTTDVVTSDIQKEDDAQRWDAIREIWIRVRDDIEGVVDGITHKGTVRRYKKIRRYNYAELIETLAAEERISREAADLLSEMNEQFLKLKRRSKSINPDALRSFQELEDKIVKKLPVQAPMIAAFGRTNGGNNHHQTTQAN